MSTIHFHYMYYTILYCNISILIPVRMAGKLHIMGAGTKSTFSNSNSMFHKKTVTISHFRYSGIHYSGLCHTFIC